MKRVKRIGILTAGGDSPGINAAIRGVGKAAIGAYGMQVIGFRDGFRGLMENRSNHLDERDLSGILTLGGTILGTSRDKPTACRWPVRRSRHDATSSSPTTAASPRRARLHRRRRHAENAFHLMQKGLNIITLPKTIDNDVALTDVEFGFDTALGIATEAIDRLHSTAHSHHRIIVVEVMGHRAGWLALGAGMAGGADVILIPEIPYDRELVAEAILRRSRAAAKFSIVAVAEGRDVGGGYAERLRRGDGTEDEARGASRRPRGRARNRRARPAPRGQQHSRLSQELEQLTGLESRVTILGHLQRGGTPSAADRFLATRLGTACAELIEERTLASWSRRTATAPSRCRSSDVAGKRKTRPDRSPLDRSGPRSRHLPGRLSAPEPTLLIPQQELRIQTEHSANRCDGSRDRNRQHRRRDAGKDGGLWRRHLPEHAVQHPTQADTAERANRDAEKHRPQGLDEQHARHLTGRAPTATRMPTSSVRWPITHATTP